MATSNLGSHLGMGGQRRVFSSDLGVQRRVFSKSCFNITEEARPVRPGCKEETWKTPVRSDPLHYLAKTANSRQLEKHLSSLSLQVLPERIENRNFSGSTPLHVATYFGNLGAVEVLQRFGANPTQRNTLGWHPGHYAARWSQPLDLRLAVGAVPSTPARNSRSFAFNKIKERGRRKKEERKGNLKSDSGISMLDSKESLPLLPPTAV